MAIIDWSLRNCARNICLTLVASVVIGANSADAQQGCYDSTCAQFFPSPENQGCGYGCSTSSRIPQITGMSGPGTDHICPITITCTGSGSCAGTLPTQYVVGNPACCSAPRSCTDFTCANYDPNGPECSTSGCSTNVCSSPLCPGYNAYQCGAGGSCYSDNDCPGGLVCEQCTDSICQSAMECGCGNPCDDPTCPGYNSDCVEQPTTCTTGTPGCADCVPPTCDGQSHWNPGLCSCVANTSPIVIDTDGSGFHLTSAQQGVYFDFFGDGRPIRIAWTTRGSTNGFLALDRNGNGLIDSAKELFGNITDQPPCNDANGFLALAVFDQPENGGNGDGIIDSRDAVWSKLLVWIDSNHDGIAQAEELHHLDEIGIHSIGLMYRESRRTDEFGNQFRYRGLLNPDRKSDVDRVIYDVILSTTGSIE